MIEKITYTGEKYFYACKILNQISDKFDIGYTKLIGSKKLIIECKKTDLLDIKNMVNIRSFMYK